MRFLFISFLFIYFSPALIIMQRKNIIILNAFYSIADTNLFFFAKRRRLGIYPLPMFINSTKKGFYKILFPIREIIQFFRPYFEDERALRKKYFLF